mmetsp:Transcript_16635/g.51709  ORF Transcript_16635/g.51709 Transcript_16635/m.51709 type:complete len:379 (-) Transcript_16635:1944-3080(-)
MLIMKIAKGVLYTGSNQSLAHPRSGPIDRYSVCVRSMMSKASEPASTTCMISSDADARSLERKRSSRFLVLVRTDSATRDSLASDTTSAWLRSADTSPSAPLTFLRMSNTRRLRRLSDASMLRMSNSRLPLSLSGTLGTSKASSDSCRYDWISPSRMTSLEASDSSSRIIFIEFGLVSWWSISRRTSLSTSARMKVRWKSERINILRVISDRYDDTSGSCSRTPFPPNRMPLRPTMSTCSSEMSCDAYVSPSTCRSSFSLASRSMYMSALSCSSTPSLQIFSASSTLNLSRDAASLRYVRSSMVRWWGLRRLSTTALESECTSTSRRLRLSSERPSRIACMMALHSMPYMMKPSALQLMPKFSTCTIPSSSAKCTSAS